MCFCAFDCYEADVILLCIARFCGKGSCISRLWERQVGTPAEEDLLSWAHHSDSATIPDAILRAASENQISFTFTCQIDGKLTPIDSFPRSSTVYTSPSLQARACASPVTRELRAPRTPMITGFSKPSSNGLSAGLVTPPTKSTTSRGFPPLSKKSPATVLPRKSAPPKKRPKITIVHKASKHMAASKHASSDESSASEYVSDDDEDEDDDFA